MRIVHVITRLIIGGAQENTLLTCEGLHRRGHDVVLIAGPQTGPEGSLLGEACSRGYEVIVLHSLVREVNPLLDWRCLRELRELLARYRPVVVHTHSSKAGILGRVAAYDAGVPCIVHTIHGMSFNRTQSLPVRMAYRALEEHCTAYTDHVITVADALRRQAIEAGLASPDRFTTVYSGVRTEWFDPARFNGQDIRRRWGFAPEHVVVGKVARMFPHKGYEYFIPAMVEAAQRDPRLRFVLVGDGASRREYEQQLVRAGIRDRVHLTGLVMPHEIPRVMSGLDFMVHASEWEGLPRTVVQGLLMEKPAIGFGIDGTPEVVLPGRTGELVPLGDVAALADAIVRMAADADRRAEFGRAGRALCVRRFDHRYMVDRIVDVYQRITPKTIVAD